ncbi:MAG: LytTR family DNA-binding domain-containing protein [Casimicrobiaceae bacterium]|nr:LytTR family DNA-binding domain-containing protein [Pseudomonadota bacterium]
MKPRALIAEDEPVLRREMQRLLASVWPELEIVAAAEDGLAAIRALERKRPNVLFLDIQMPGLSGIEVARAASGHAHVVFVTAYDQYAVAAFEKGAVDYVMKPISAARLDTACQRVKRRLDSTPANLDDLLARLAERASTMKSYLRWINVSRGAEVVLVTVEEICYFQADAKYTNVVTAHSQELIRTSLRELRDELDPSMFWQIHRAALVNVNAIASVAKDMRGQVTLKLKQRNEILAVSQPYAHLFRQM